MAAGDRSAQILFFTGVRYQRVSEDPHAPGGQPRPTGASARAARLAGQDAEALANASRSQARNWPPFRPPRKIDSRSRSQRRQYYRPAVRLPPLAISAMSRGGTPLPNERRPSERMAQHDDHAPRRSACERVFFFRPLRKAPRLDPRQLSKTRRSAARIAPSSARPSSSSRSTSRARCSAFPPTIASASRPAPTPARSKWRSGRCSARAASMCSPGKASAKAGSPTSSSSSSSRTCAR